MDRWEIYLYYGLAVLVALVIALKADVPVEAKIFLVLVAIGITKLHVMFHSRER